MNHLKKTIYASKKQLEIGFMNYFDTRKITKEILNTSILLRPRILQKSSSINIILILSVRIKLLEIF